MNDNERKAKIAKLPKWAQHYVQKLESDLAASNRDKSAMLCEVEGDAQVVLPHFHGVERDQSLQKHQSVQFFTNKRKGRWRGFIEARINHTTGRVEIRGADSLMIEPQASNAFSVRLKKRDE